MIGKKISHFHINECLGEGGMGTVYKATDMNLNRYVAIKMLHPHMMKHSDAFKRFQNEAQLSAKVSHPNVATLLDFQQAEGLHYIVMEYVDGIPLDKLLKLQEKLSPKEAIKITLQTLEGLEAAHELGIMHRDLKPGNIMVSKRGYVKLMDFGIARLENAERMTRQNSVIGTLEYLAPELIKGETPSKSSDLYAVGVMLYEMLAGRTLFEGDTEATLMYNIAHKQASINLPGVDRRLIRVIKKLTHKQKAKRYQSIPEVIQDLEAIQPGGRIAPLLLKEKVAVENLSPTLKPVQQLLSNQKLPALLKLDLSAISQPKMPFGLDIRIIAAAIGLSLLIVLLGTIGGSEAASDLEDDLSSTNMPAERESNHKNGLSIQPAHTVGNQPQEIVVGEWDGEAVESPIGTKEDTPESKSKKHQIKKLDESSARSKPKETDRSRKKVAQKESSAIQSPKSANTVQIPETMIAAVFNQKISTETHREGQIFYLKTPQATRIKNQVVIQKGAKVQAKIKELVKAENSKKKALLAVDLISVQAVNGEWLPLNHSGYSLKSRGKVELPSGFQISRVKLRAGTIRLD